MSNFTTVKAARLAKDKDAPDPAEVDNAREFLNRATSLKEDFVADAKESYSTMEVEGKLTVWSPRERVGVD